MARRRRTPSRATYAILNYMAPVILDNQGKGTIAMLQPAGDANTEPQTLKMGGYTLTITYGEGGAVGPAGGNGVRGTRAAGGGAGGGRGGRGGRGGAVARAAVAAAVAAAAVVAAAAAAAVSPMHLQPASSSIQAPASIGLWAGP